jgi:UDP-glucose 4-epimerase
MKKRLLITGATGSVGMRVVRAATMRGHSVVTVSRQQNAWPDQSNVTHVRCDIRDIKHLANLIANTDAVCHLAAHIPKNFSDPSESVPCFEMNSHVTLALAQSTLDAGKRFIFASSGSIYEGADTPRSEDDKVFPSSHAPYYLGSKLLAELYVEHLRCRHQLDSVIFRVASVYGPGCDKSVVARFIANVMARKPIQLTDGGQATADFVFVDDLATLMLAAVESSACGVFNAGSGVSSSILDVAKAVCESFMEFEPHIEFVAKDGTKPVQFPALLMKKTSETFGHYPTSFRTGLDLLRHSDL